MRLLKDLYQNEVDFNFKMLPEVARNEQNTQVFTQDEEYEDMVKNVQYNKKQAKMLRDNLDKIKPTKAKIEGNDEDEESKTVSEPE